MRDITLEEIVYFNFTTRAFSSGVPTTLSGSPVLSVLESNNATPITSGVSVSVDRASVTGLNQATVVATAANGYEAGKSYAVYISTGTVGGVSVVGEVVAQFTVQSAASFTRLGAPAGASVSADVAAIKAETATILSDTNDIQTRLPAALVSGRMDASVGAIASGVDFSATMKASINTEVDTALSDVRLDELLAADSDIDGAAPPTVGSVFHELMTKTAGSFTYDQTTDSLEALRDRGDAAWITATGFSTLDAAGVRAAVGLASANLDTQLDALPTAAENATAVWAAGTRSLTILDEDSTTLDLDATIRAAVGLASANLDTQLSTIDTVVDSILVDTAEIGAAGAGLTAIPWNASWDAEVQSEVNDGLIAYDAATGTDVTTAAANVSVDEIQATALADLFNTDSGTTYASAVAGSVVKEIADNAGGSGLTLADIADAVWDEAIAGHAGAGSTGEALSAAGAAGDPWITALPGSYSAGQAGYIIGTNLNATVSSRATQTSVDTIDDFLDTEIAAILADTNELQTDWANGGRLDLILDARASQASVDTIDDFLDTEVAAIKAKTDQIQFAGGYVLSDMRAIASAPVAVDTGTAGTVSFVSGEYVATSGGTVNANVTQIDGENVVSDGSGRIRIDTSELPDAAAINAEVVDALSTDTYAEPGQGIPGATISLSAKVGYLYKAWRNKSEQTADTYSLYNDNESTVGQQASVSDDATTFTRGEMASG